MPIDPKDCAPSDPRRNADLKDLIGPFPENVRFDAENARKITGQAVDLEMAESAGAYAEHKMLSGVARAEHQAVYDDKQGAFSNIGNWFRTPFSLFPALERHTKIPFASEMYNPVEAAIDTAERLVSPAIDELHALGAFFRTPPALGKFGKKALGISRNERADVQRMFEAKYVDTATYDAMKAKFPPHIAEATEQYEGILRRYFVDAAGFKEDDFQSFFHQFPIIRKADGDFTKARKLIRSNPMMESIADSMRSGETMLDSRSYDFFQIGTWLVRSYAQNRLVRPQVRQARRLLAALDKDKAVQGDHLGLAIRYLDTVEYMPDEVQVSIARAYGKIYKLVTGNPMPPKDALNFVPGFLSVNYFANMAFSPGVAIRNFMQPLTTTYPIIGAKDTKAGFDMALRVLTGKDVQGMPGLDFFRDRNVITRSVRPMQGDALRQSMSVATDKIQAGTHLSNALRKGQTAGWWMFKGAEDTNRILSYWGMHVRSERFAKQYVKGKISFKQYKEMSKLDMIGDDVLFDRIQAVLGTGDVGQAAHLQALHFTNHTQFIYRRGNNPRILQSTVGRLLGQYGTWPSWYANYMQSMLLKGSYKNRIKTATRWTAANGAIVLGGSQVLGVDLTKWAFFSPLGYQGGPHFEMGGQALSAINVAAGSKDPADRINAARLPQAYQQLLPIPFAASRGFRDGIEAGMNEDWPLAFKRILGFPPAK
jgi:hypothetical protein